MHMIPAPHKVYRNYSLDRNGAHSWMEEVCGHHCLNIPGKEALKFRYEGHRLNLLSIAIIGYGTDASIGIEGHQALRCFSLSLPVEGEQLLYKDGHEILSDSQRGVIVNPYENQTLNIEGRCRKLQISIPTDLVTGALESLLGRQIDAPLAFEPGMMLADRKIQSWWNLTQNLLNDMETAGSLFDLGIIQRDYENILIKALLMAQRHNYSQELSNVLAQSPPHYVLLARKFIESHAPQDICLADIVIASGVHKLKLFEGFNRYFNTTPVAYLRQYRMMRIREDIINDGSRKNISEIAMYWGMTHLSRFSGEYKVLFGESPRKTAERFRSKKSLS